ncbi:MAG: hypothetical protein ACFHWZ_13485 [Phycisphaerales bacterium]
MLPKDLIRKHLVLPLGKERGRLVLLMHDPKDLELLDLIRFRQNTEVEPKMCARQAQSLHRWQDGGRRKADGARRQRVAADRFDRQIDRQVRGSFRRFVDRSGSRVRPDHQALRAHYHRGGSEPCLRHSHRAHGRPRAPAIPHRRCLHRA